MLANLVIHVLGRSKLTTPLYILHSNYNLGLSVCVRAVCNANISLSIFFYQVMWRLYKWRILCSNLNSCILKCLYQQSYNNEDMFIDFFIKELDDVDKNKCIRQL